MNQNNNLKAIAIGSLACVFFSSTYTVNSYISAEGGHWAWTVGLRTSFLAILLLPLLMVQGRLKPLVYVMRQNLWVWVGWGGLAFGIVYIFLTSAAFFGPGWLVAGVFQFTIVAGILLSPLIYNDARGRIPVRALLLSVLILAGIALMQWSQRNGSYTQQDLWICVVLVLIGAALWPLANRKVLLHTEEESQKLNAMQRVAGMAIGSLPVQLCLMLYGYSEAGLPGASQITGTLVIALSSGVIGGVLFFVAMNMVRHNSAALAAVEATQSIEIIATLVGEIILLGIAWPGPLANMGMLLVMGGLMLYSIPARQKAFRLRKVRLR
ncbi:putative multidrug resistance efflux transporter [Pontibacter mucosus]|uniref:Putative multidrug resistance efflux transporter n=1 Tax=Pontibacter mucosus TaxID=1649266 RepID=A0A2T5YLS8_9BACT|nr:multidrug resistance efflux transporter family protein [Pontibacter mucosus]PTX20278.1 putative multidrug resistance efflux transporter [Pontibacter mucosus]